MTPKEIYKFIIEQSPEPLIKNPVLRKVVDQEMQQATMGGAEQSLSDSGDI